MWFIFCNMQGTRIGALLDELERAARKKRLTKKQLATMVGLHQNTLRDFRGYRCRAKPDAPQWTPSIDTIAKLEPILLPRRLRESSKPQVQS
jgi:hypothetical protein